MQSVAAGAQVPGCTNRLFDNAELALRNWDIPLLPSESASSPLAPGALLGAVAARQPVGVVGCITPYNFPLTNTAGKIGPALAMGNTVMIKPAPQDPLGSIELVKVLDEVGFPPGVVNLVTGSSPEVGAALVDSPDVDMISFTGISVVGAKIFEAGGKTMKRLLWSWGKGRRARPGRRRPPRTYATSPASGPSTPGRSARRPPGWSSTGAVPASWSTGWPRGRPC